MHLIYHSSSVRTHSDPTDIDHAYARQLVFAQKSIHYGPACVCVCVLVRAYASVTTESMARSATNTHTFAGRINKGWTRGVRASFADYLDAFEGFKIKCIGWPGLAKAN